MQARRGYVPKDDRFFSRESLGILREASKHVCYLINNGYDLKQASTFVGDHFQLSDRQRIAIMRGVATDGQLEDRRSKEISIEGLRGREVWIDGFNTIITLEVMLSDSTLLACMDGAVRDLAALRGTYRIIPVTSEASRLLFDVLCDAEIRKATILLDEPVSNSGRLKALLAEVGEAYSFDLDIRVLNGVDRMLYARENVISSDSVILDRCASWANLVGHCLELRRARALRIW